MTWEPATAVPELRPRHAPWRRALLLFRCKLEQSPVDNQTHRDGPGVVAPPQDTVSDVVKETESAAHQTAESPAGGAANISAKEAISEADTAELVNDAPVPVELRALPKEHVAEIRA